MSRGVVAEIDLSALKHNLACVKRFAPQSKVLAMVKADGYGHGLLRIAKGLAEADALGVACLSEALELREAGITNRIVLMEGALSADELPLVDKHRLDIVIHHQTQLKQLASTKLQAPLDVWLKCETGMHRLGLDEQTFQCAYQWAMSSPDKVATTRLMTHFACADALCPDSTATQIACFDKMTAGKNAEKTLANSAGILGWPSAHADWVRPGIMLYGISPIADKTAAEYGLKPVMQLKSKVISVKSLTTGDAVGYGSTWRAAGPTTLAVVAMGYGDGYPRHIASGAPIRIAGKTLPIVGRISMDMLTVDCGHYPEVAVGDEVVLWGDELPVERVAAAAGTIAYECVTQLTRRVDIIERA